MKMKTAHARFCAVLARTGNASQAFREAFPARAKRMKDKSIHEVASRLAGDVKVQSRVRALQERAQEIANVTFDSHVKQMGRLRELAVRQGQIGAAIRAEEGRAKVAGLYASDAPLRTPRGQEPEVPPADVPTDAEAARALLLLHQAEKKAGVKRPTERPS